MLLSDLLARPELGQEGDGRRFCHECTNLLPDSCFYFKMLPRGRGAARKITRTLQQPCKACMAQREQENRAAFRPSACQFCQHPINRVFWLDTIDPPLGLCRPCRTVANGIADDELTLWHESLVAHQEAIDRRAGFSADVRSMLPKPRRDSPAFCHHSDHAECLRELRRAEGILRLRRLVQGGPSPE